ncbi:TPA: FUSC family protein [Klebsiella pneumoniae]|nr:FUSC family protein [Klebsiella pneumoniae]
MPRKSEWLYSSKLFISAMMAFGLAESIGLQNPYWAMVTCCVLNHSISGSVRARALYRFGGTLFAGIVTLLLSSLLINAPVLLVIVTGLVSTLMLGLSYTERTPRAYFFQLGAITMMLVAIAYVNHPDTMFNMVVTRLTEICFGILCVTFVDSLLFPSSLEPALNRRVQGWVSDLELWLDDVFTTRINSAESERKRLNAMNDIATFNQVMMLLRHDPSVPVTKKQAATALQRHMLALYPATLAVNNCLHAMPEPLKNKLLPYITRVRAATKMEHTNDSAQAKLSVAEAEQMTEWEKIVCATLADSVKEMLEHLQKVKALKALLKGKPVPVTLLHKISQARIYTPPADIGHVITMMLCIGTTYTLLCALWFVTGWEQGANMVLMGVIGIAFYGANDDPGRTIANFGKFASVAMLVGAVLSYGLLPLASDFISFLVVMALVFLPMGIWACRNSSATLALALALSNINFQGHYNPYDLGLFLDNLVATLIGVFVAFLSAALFRRWGAAHAIDRLLKIDAQEMKRLTPLSSDKTLLRYQDKIMDRMLALSERNFPGQNADNQGPVLMNRLESGIYLSQLYLAVKHSVKPADYYPSLEAIKENVVRKDNSRLLFSNIDQSLSLAWQNKDFALIYPLIRLRLLHVPDNTSWNIFYD